ncbi:polyunsaturated fatty acid 5-lipoxygenase-like isoform X2 [Patiria miniata]|uniref:Arachidonate 5-lipoxygenase n=1 Tax=Patiria miniata TaxID=46514 RepID=A0A913YY67_PATMI|nr:polyunsaturated fatty acid 5-lipoxygenase-like isoform X2 [Patiria miniata]
MACLFPCCRGGPDDVEDGPGNGMKEASSEDNLAGAHTHYKILVKTGDLKGAGTDANIYIILHNENQVTSKKIKLDRLFHDDFERGKTDEFKAKLPSDFGAVHEIELWRDEHGAFDPWYLEKVDIYEKPKDGAEKGPYEFPIHRWIPGKKSVIFCQYDSLLPQQDPRKETQRKEELDEIKKIYQFKSQAPDVGLPCQVAALPSDEKFSFDYLFDIAKRKANLLLQSKLSKIFTGKWESLDDLSNVYHGKFPKPAGMHMWRSDIEFGLQRLIRCNPTQLKLFTEVPEKFGVTDELVAPFLEGMTIQEAIEKKKLYYVDYEILLKLPVKQGTPVVSPIGLFFVDKDKHLIPVALQLEQQKAPDNPIFVPSDPEYTWLLAKMWFNFADASYHQSATHLGLTHLAMESVAATMHYSLSPSHPLFRLLAPHFLFLMAINSRGLALLISVDGWVDKTMNIGRDGMFDLIGRAFKKWRLNVEGTLPNDLKNRGVDDTEALPNYHYRDDALLIYDAMKKYVTEVVEAHYETPEMIVEDYELQEWGRLMNTPQDEGGVGVQGVPADGKFATVEDVISTITPIMFTCSVSHGVANFSQYDDYAFPPHYPAGMRMPPPTDKSPRTEKDILDNLPDKNVTVDVMTVTRLLSEKATKSLGDFEVQYGFCPIAVKALEEFRKELKHIGIMIDERNRYREFPYDYCHPNEVPNAISI